MTAPISSFDTKPSQFAATSYAPSTANAAASTATGAMDADPLRILQDCGFHPFDFTHRTSAANHIKSLLRDRLKVPPSALATDVWHYESRYIVSGAQEWRARVYIELDDGRIFGGDWTQWNPLKTKATEESALIALTAAQHDDSLKNLFLKPLPGPDDPNPISTVRNYLRDRSIYKDRMLDESVSTNESPVSCTLRWGHAVIGMGSGIDRLAARTAASVDCLRRWERAMKFIEFATYNKLLEFHWLQLPA